MLTDNFKKWQKFVLTNTTVSDSPQPIGETFVSTAANGTTTDGLTHILCDADSFAECYSAIHQSLVYVGSGSTPASVTDVRMESPIVPGLYITVITNYSGEFKNHSAVVNISAKVQNISGSTLTINEVGWAKGLMLSDSASSAPSVKYLLMAREVLTEPVTLGAGDAKTFDLKFIF